ncbi:peptidoglycan-binding domain-containing protein [Streptomyces barringtoniae]|uniref:peptidoglycan-binding domain-containing protein n=1 Tax=Streptomyces barringtoniae TaxID=2892029 RepID=UPI001E4E05D0|nr:peptidoglycan-binding domain-containing protein [Streptomyces barringtoniae]MCC5474905.1 peptidoglycan-binding protein [Streptomyces barringtoniae]
MPTPPDSERPQPRPVLEPVRVLRPRRLDGLAELMREMDGAAAQAAETDEAETQELPRVPVPPRTTQVLRRAAVAGAVAAAALLGFGCALLLTGRQQAAATPPTHRPATTAPPAAAPPPAPTASAAPTAATDPDGPGTLRQGDSGPEVTDLQKRLLRIPDVYRDGSTSGTYDSVLTAAVARFQLWYGISGDETGVYGDDTRRALESRTSLGDDS